MAIDKTEQGRQAEPNRQTAQAEQGGKAQPEKNSQKQMVTANTNTVCGPRKKKPPQTHRPPVLDENGKPLLNKDGTPRRTGKPAERCKTQKVEVVEAEEITPQSISEARLQDAIDRTVKRIEGRQRKNSRKNCSIEDKVDASRDEIRRVILNSLHWWRLEAPTSDEQVAERLNEFFAHCTETGELPTMEKLFLAVGTDNSTGQQWLHGQGCSPERAGMMQKSRQVMAALDAEFVSTGKIPQVTYIFRSKNYYGMSNKQETVITVANPLGAELSEADLAARIAADVVDTPALPGIDEALAENNSN